MGNGTCNPQASSNTILTNSTQPQLLNSQQKSPYKPAIESVNPTIAKIEDDEFNISIDEDIFNKPSTSLSPQRKSKSKKSKRDKELLELLTKDKTFIRRSSQGLSPVKILSTKQKSQRTTFVIEHSELLKFKRELEQNDELSKPKPILKNGSERSSQSPTQKKVKFGLIFKQI